MLNPPNKTCRQCSNEPAPMRRLCVKCIQKNEREKAQKKKESLKLKETNKKSKLLEKKRFSRSNLTKEADRVYSLYIRSRDRYKPCITCWAEWQENFQCWHFISRRHLSTRWEEKNWHWQCPKCNLWGAWEQFLHSRAIESLYWDGTSDRLHELSQILTTTDQEILEYIQKYYEKLSDLGLEYKPKKYYGKTESRSHMRIDASD